MKHIKAWHILLVGWALFLVHAYPGMMTRDSFDQLRQARTGIFLDDHPPLMQAIVWVTDRIVAGPFGIVLAQSAMLLAGAYLLLARVLTPRVAAGIAVAVLLFPPISAVMVVMWKDPMMAGALLLSAALITSERRGVRLVALALALVATGVRFNGLAATFAIIVLLFEWLPPRQRVWQQRLARYGCAVAVWIAVTAASFGVHAVLTDRETHFFHTQLVDDVVGTLRFVDTTRSDSSLRRALAGTNLRVRYNIHETLRQAYRSDAGLDLVLGDARVFDLPLADVDPPSPELRAALMRAWKEIVLANPVAFARYRLDRFRVVLGMTTADETVWDRPIIVTHDFQDKGALVEYGIPTAISPFQSGVDAMFSWLSHTWLFRPYVYFAISLALLWLARRHRIALALLLSGLGMELSLLPLAHSMDYRYSHWMVITTTLAAILLFIDRRRGRPDAVDLRT